MAIVAAAVMAAPSGASAATTVGQTFVPATANSCGGSPDFEILQTGRATGPSYATPSAGVLTSWSFEGSGAVQTVMTLRVFRPTGTTHQYTVIADGSSELKTIAASSDLNTFPTQIPVHAGDFVGIHSTSGRCTTQTGNLADTYDYRLGTSLAVGAQGTFSAFSTYIVDISAKLEPDCDNDGLGDETQDPNLSSCSPGTGGGTGGGTGQGTGPAPTLPSGAPATCKGAPATIVGTEGNDVRIASQGADVIVGLGGNDTLSGLGGNDLICGGPGKDTLKGGADNDSLLGQKGKDKLKGGGGPDFCKGGKGKDTASKCEVEKSI